MQDFREPLFSCEKTPGLFCFLLTFSCIGGPCCVQAKINSEFSKQSILIHYLFPCLCLCIGGTYNRQSLRNQLGLPPSPLPDCLIHTFCTPCAVNQEFLEYSSSGKSRNFTMLSIIKDKPNKGSFTPLAPIDSTVN